MTTCYATLWDARAENKASSASDDPYLLKALRTVSRRIDHLLTDPRYPRPVFAPFIETRRVLVNSLNTNSSAGTLDLPGPLLSLTAVNASGSALTIGTNVTVYPDADMPPFTALQLLYCYDGSWYSSCADCGTAPYASVSGVWGYSGDYANAFVKVDTLAAALNDTTTLTFTVHTVDGTGLDGSAPAFSPGSLVQIDSEWMNVIVVNNAAKTVTVEARGANGSTAAVHADGAEVRVWQVESDIRRVVARQAAFINARRGAFNTVEITAAGSELRYPPDLLPELRAALAPYAYIL